MPATSMFSSRASFTGVSLPLCLVVPGLREVLVESRQDRGTEAGEPGKVSGDLGGVDLPRVVAHDAKTVVQRHSGAVHSRESLQGEPRGRGTAAARHLGDMKANGGRVRSLDRNAQILRPCGLESPAAQRAQESRAR